MKRLAAHTLIGVLVLCAGASALACSDNGNKLTIQDYFAKIDKLDQVRAEKDDALNAQLEALEDAQVPEAIALMGKQVDALHVFVEAAGKIDPPDEVAEAHNAALENLGAVASEFRRVLDTADEPDSMDELRELFADVDYAKFDAAGENCQKLERIASDNDIQVDLDCGE